MITTYCGWHRQNWGTDLVLKQGDTDYEHSSHSICRECEMLEDMRIQDSQAQ